MARSFVAPALACCFVLACADPDEPNPEAGDEVGSESESTDEGTTGEESDEASDESADTGMGNCSEVGPWSTGFAIPVVPQAPGDPEAGRWALLNEDYVTCGIPWELFGLAKGAMGSLGEG